MSATGTYKFIDGELVKVSDRIPRIGYIEAGIFKSFVDRNIDGTPREFTSLRQWKNELSARGMFEVPRDAQKTGFWDQVKKNKPKSKEPKEVAADALAKLAI